MLVDRLYNSPSPRRQDRRGLAKFQHGTRPRAGARAVWRRTGVGEQPMADDGVDLAEAPTDRDSAWKLNKATVRILTVLTAFAAHRASYGVTELSQKLGMTEHGVPRAQHPGRPGLPGARGVGRALRARLPRRRAAQPAPARSRPAHPGEAVP